MSNEPASHYDTPTRERCMVALALHSGNASRAARDLSKVMDNAPSRATLSRWKREYIEDYERVRGEVLPRVREQLTEQHYELATYQAKAARDVAEKTVERFKSEGDDLKLTELTKIMSAFDIGSGIHTQRGAELTRDPVTVLHAHGSIEDLERSLGSKGIKIEYDVEGSATRIKHDDEDEAVSEGLPALPSGSSTD